MNFLLKAFVSIILGAAVGTLYGFSFFAKGLRPATEKELTPEQLRKRRFLRFFLYSSLRILLIGCLWYFILRTQIASIILVMLSFLASFWIVIIKRKAHHYERL